ncbi:hypothetical protein BGLA2_560002 [Burkholderia gladioli]|nr:hypothetical protein BGLA2_560002 [Burkholderia gladioli]
MHINQSMLKVRCQFRSNLIHRIPIAVGYRPIKHHLDRYIFTFSGTAHGSNICADVSE